MSNSTIMPTARNARYLLAVALFSSVASVLPVQAQTRIQGRVIDDETLAPIVGVQVLVLDDNSRSLGTRLTDEQGFFEFTPRSDGGVSFRASRIGYRTATTPVLWTERRNFIQVEIRLNPQAVLLAPIEVVAWSPIRPSPVLAGFRDRMASGLGHYFTRQDIERARPTYVSDLVATVAGVRLASSGPGSSRTVYMSRSRGISGECPAQIFVDGFLYNKRSLTGGDMGFTIDQAVSPGDVEGIEIYRGLGGVPAEFLNPDSRCGVVAIWTRRGGRWGPDQESPG